MGQWPTWSAQRDHSDASPTARPFHLLCRDLRLIESLRLDQVAHCLGLGEIDAAAQKGALGKLTGIGQTRARRERVFHQGSQDHRRAVRGDLDHILARVGMRGGKIRHHGLVQPGPRFAILRCWLENLSEARLRMGERVAQPQNPLSNALGFCSREPPRIT